jgi:hypothetical protein
MDLRPVIMGYNRDTNVSINIEGNEGIEGGAEGNLVDGTTGENAGGFELSTTTFLGLDRTLSINSIATNHQCVSFSQTRKSCVVEDTEHQQHGPTFPAQQEHPQSAQCA